MAQTTNKYQIIQKISSDETLLIHPETEADAVLFDNAGSGLKSSNIADAVTELVGEIDKVKTEAVTGVKGNNESSYRKGNVNLTYENIGAEPSGSVDIHNISVTAHQDIRTSVANAQSKADSAYALAEGRSKAASFDTKQAMIAALKGANKNAYNIGDNLFIKAVDSPDYWVSGVLDSNASEYGYFEISPLETEKVDLSSYQTKTDNTLTTANKTIVGAIGEVKTKADGADSKAKTNATELANIKNGTTKVGKATSADSAVSANKATTADKWITARTITVGVNSGTKQDGTSTIGGTGSVAVDGSADKSLTVNLGDSGVQAGTYSALQVNSKGIAVAGGQMIEIGGAAQNTPSNSLAAGGLFFKLI